VVTSDEFPIRSCFEVPPPELSITGKPRKLIVYDFSQIELRIAAHMSQDPLMMDVYINQGGDIHTETCRNVWDLVDENGVNARDLPLSVVKKKWPKQRRDAKPVNY
jgi:DNA polymerase I-like protein with 3'-5' exonuclease and polymerase domains